MLNYSIQVEGGKTYKVSLERIAKETYRVSINGEQFEAEHFSTGDFEGTLLRLGDDTFRAHAKLSTSNTAQVWIGGVEFSASLRPVSQAEAFPPQTTIEKGAEIRAQMPGRVTSLLVKENDTVETGTPLLILEAMKMQNEIASPVAGRVKVIRVQEGSTVKKDSVLIEIF